MSKLKVAIIGATGLVGQTFLKVLAENNEDFDLKLFASSKSQGKRIKFQNRYYIVNKLDENAFNDIDYACFFATKEISKKYVPIALRKNIKVIDNSSYFRMDDNVKLIAYGVNEHTLTKDDRLIANPNCCTIQSVLSLNPLRKYRIEKIIYSTYQSVSGSGKKGIDDLLRCRKGNTPLVYEEDISFTCIPKIGNILENNFSDEEEKMICETKKIFNDYNIEILATCVRVPIMFSHGVSICLQVKERVIESKIIDDIKEQSQLVCCDSFVPTSTLSCKSDKVYIGRSRVVNNNIMLYCVADNIRVGAATNAYLILKHMIKIGEENG